MRTNSQADFIPQQLRLRILQRDNCDARFAEACLSLKSIINYFAVMAAMMRKIISLPSVIGAIHHCIYANASKLCDIPPLSN